MTGSSDTPDRRENPAGTPQTGPPYPYPDSHHISPPISPVATPATALLRLPAARRWHPRMGSVSPRWCWRSSRLLSVATVFAPIVLGVVAVVFGFLGRGRVKRGTANNGGVAIAGIVLGALGDHRRIGVHRDLDDSLEGRRRRRLHRLHAESRLQPRPAAAVRRSVSAKRARPVERHVDADTGALARHKAAATRHELQRQQHDRSTGRAASSTPARSAVRPARGTCARIDTTTRARSTGPAHGSTDRTTRCVRPRFFSSKISGNAANAQR